LYLDFEHAFDASYAHHLGLNLDPAKFILCQPDTFEQGEEIIKMFLVNEKDNSPLNLLSAIVVDSAAAMTPKAELEGEVDAPTRIGLQAQLMARFLSRATKWISKGTKPPMVVLNQTRTKIDVKNPANNGETAAGGLALKFYATIRLQLEATRGEGEEGRSKDPSRGTDQVFTRHRVRVTCVKNKVAPPWMRGTLVFEFGTGINNLMSVAELSEKRLGIMSGAGFFSYQGDTQNTSFKCRGREEFVKALEANEPLFREIEAKLLVAIKAEHAKALGLKEIKVGGVAKAVEGEVVLQSIPQSEMSIEEVGL
jgi:recombination protein RecA